MKSVCAKHEQAYEDSCPWCEKKAEGPTAAPAAPHAPRAGCLYCAGPAKWLWTGVATGAETRMCQSHHDSQLVWQKDRLGEWNKEPLP